MPTRRNVLAFALVLGWRPGARAEAMPGDAILGDDGLYREPWFLESFLDLADDLRGAAEHGRRFAILWELKGCPFCKQLHKINFADEAVGTFIRDRFDILQLNLVGAREVTDFDGERLPEKRFAEKYGIRSTPTIQFFPPSGRSLAAQPPAEREVLRMTRYMPPKEFRKAFAFVADQAYERTTLDAYLTAPNPDPSE